MNISKLIFALVFTLTFSFSSFAANSSLTDKTETTERVKNKFTATFSSTIKNQATANITNNQGTIIVTLTNEQGTILHEKAIKAESATYTISLDKLPKGTYFLQLLGDDNSTYETYYVN